MEVSNFLQISKLSNVNIRKILSDDETSIIFPERRDKTIRKYAQFVRNIVDTNNFNN